MTLNLWPRATSPKHIDDVLPGEIFRFEDNELGIAFGPSPTSQASRPWSHIVDLTTFKAQSYSAVETSSLTLIYSLGSDWSLRCGGEGAKCSLKAAPTKGCIIATSRGRVLVADGLNGQLCFYLEGERLGGFITLPGDLEGAVFDTWSLLAKEHPSSSFEMTRLDFSAHRA